MAEDERGASGEPSFGVHDIVKLNTSVSNSPINVSNDIGNYIDMTNKEMSETNFTTYKTKIYTTTKNEEYSLVNIIYKYKPNRIANYLWYFISFSNIITIDINGRNDGTELQFSTFDALTMFLATYLLLLSFEKEKPLLAILWVITFFWSIYTCQYLSLVQLRRTCAYMAEGISIFKWFAYGALIFSLGLRFTLWIKVLDFLIGTEFIRFSVYWLEVIGYMSKRITMVRTMIPKNIT